ncbi:carbohydrate ABC transporter permease [Limimaricola pyoseonensis]|uniref:Carbohydrate ABC transporter membrane protein 1, CUT1 family n=1 Tax=Limimaricola pyoseonensis TaxID=521013 RepID=A0A1G7CCL2_9RHOB|nr:sugar ABC transporter permease [Limimaricola pyoseonensis]SDE36973.1 carbohydrate ABC transporter membrane protein 1, CUT1 family [Limimaricola pyoseonensis]
MFSDTSSRLSKVLAPLLFLLPALAIYLTFAIYPTLSVVQYSFHDWDGISPDMEWVGLGNYLEMFDDRIFWEAFRNTFAWSAFIIVINVGLGLVIAAMLSRVWRARLILQTAIVLPVVLAPVTVATIWRWMYQPDGVINEAFRGVGLEALATPWLGSPDVVLFALAFAHSWSTIGLSVIIFLAGLQAVDEDLYDAAKVDGATTLQAFRHVTMPALRPVTAVVFILTLTASFKVFDIIWATTQGGPIRSSELLSTYMYKRGALENNYGYGAAIGVALLVIVSLATIIYMQIQEKKDA